MKTCAIRIFAALAVLLACTFAPTARAGLFMVTNVSTLANTFECYLTSTNIDCTIGTNAVPVHMMMYRDDRLPAPSGAAGLPVPVIRMNVGQTMICHYKNNATNNNETSSIHWHGIELDNDSDGTGVTQDAVLVGQSYNYQFVAPRPGLFWFHSHMTPGSATFAGMYGVIIIANPGESNLISSGVLPDPTNSYTLAMSDIEVNPLTGMVGKQVAGNWYTLNQVISACHTNPGNGNAFCGASGTPGSRILVNGQVPDPVAKTPMFTVQSGTKIRLRLLNEAISRNFRLTLLTNGNPNLDRNLYRIGGQGGLLEYARLEGGVQGSWNTLYSLGEINIGSGEREDAIIVPSGANGDIIQLVGNPLPQPYQLSQNLPANYPVAYFKIQGTNVNLPPITNGTPILAAIGQTILNIKTNTNLSPLTNPAAINMPGTNDPTIHIQNGAAVDSGGVSYNSIPNIDGVAPELDGNSGNGDFLSIHRPNSTLYAHIGDLIQLSARNETGGGPSVHPFHLHGFSMQPVAMVGATDANILYSYNYNEFVDTVDIQPGQALIYRLLLEDRGRICDSAPSFPPGPVVAPCTSTATNGGGLGRWVFHCHIFLHSGIGMIGELDIIGNPPPPQQTNFTALPQLTTNGMDIQATSPSGGQTVADDFFCSSNALITGVSIWGSWTNDIVDTNVTFELKFWTDVPGTNTIPSRPGWQSWRQLFGRGAYTSTLVATLESSPFYNTAASNILATGTKVFRYDFAVPPSIAYFAKSNQYTWMSVTAYTTNRFGWKTAVTNSPFRAPAEWSPTLIGPHWSPLFYPGGSWFAGAPMNAAFQLTTPSGPAPSSYEPPVATITPELSYSINNGQIGVSWFGAGVLQYADSLDGPWHVLEDVSSPYVAPTDAPQRFYRLMVP